MGHKFEEHLLCRIVKQENGCWEWKGIRASCCDGGNMPAQRNRASLHSPRMQRVICARSLCSPPLSPCLS
jgi:hypothetical protein